ncbi:MULTISPECIES: LPXTG cell wall anchor domain-containing protein [unclassified Embleya]|uniref:LPXTG cell wall anchor domain-containing protein n=1 Tax=unclassified Embleya TaxID=2699296 RepID=UPI0033E3A685
MRDFGGGDTAPAAQQPANKELASTGSGANMAFLIVGGAAMAAGGFTFTVLPARLKRRQQASAA